MRRHRLSIAGCDYEAIGNIFLLNDMDIRAVRISRRFQPEELHDLKVCWLRTIENGGVLRFSVHKRCGEAGARLCHSQRRPTDSDRAEWVRAALQAVGGNIFELCAEGRLLMVAPVEHSTSKIVLSREWCLRHNELAEQIEAGNWSLA